MRAGWMIIETALDRKALKFLYTLNCIKCYQANHNVIITPLSDCAATHLSFDNYNSTPLYPYWGGVILDRGAVLGGGGVIVILLVWVTRIRA
jgi:hypothetical protein